MNVVSVQQINYLTVSATITSLEPTTLPRRNTRYNTREHVFRGETRIKRKGNRILIGGPNVEENAEKEAKIKGIGKVLAGLGTGRIHRCAVYNRGSCNAITCWIPIQRGHWQLVSFSIDNKGFWFRFSSQILFQIASTPLNINGEMEYCKENFIKSLQNHNNI